MAQQIIVSVGREHGSGGHYVAQMIAESLGIHLYDKDIVERTVETSGYDEELIRKMDEKPVNFFTSRRVGSYSNSLEENVAEKIFEFLRSRADAGESFVVVGRCAEYILKDNPHVVSIFVSGDKQDKIARIARVDQVSEQKAYEIMKSTDRKRKTYHNYYCDKKWGDSRAYDILLNTSKVGIENSAAGLTNFVQEFMALQDGTHPKGRL